MHHKIYVYLTCRQRKPKMLVLFVGLEKTSEYSLALSAPDNNTTGPLNIRGTINLSFWRPLLVIYSQVG